MPVMDYLQEQEREQGKSDKMRAGQRRDEIMRILLRVRHTTMQALAHELRVRKKYISMDIQALKKVYPIITKEGRYGGVSLPDDYMPNNFIFSKDVANTLTLAIHLVEPYCHGEDEDIVPTLQSMLNYFYATS